MKGHSLLYNFLIENLSKRLQPTDVFSYFIFIAIIFSDSSQVDGVKRWGGHWIKMCWLFILPIGFVLSSSTFIFHCSTFWQTEGFSLGSLTCEGFSADRKSSQCQAIRYGISTKFTSWKFNRINRKFQENIEHSNQWWPLLFEFEWHYYLKLTIVRVIIVEIVIFALVPW